ncbi:MAG: hypothetical protein JRF63_03825, partial [Deltaproteobacteria bacterium]|nr:hypothetical protein [Deltaproteobacteria bacterium]
MQRTGCLIAGMWLCIAALTCGCWKMQDVWIPEVDAGTETDAVAGVVVGAVRAGGGGEDTSLAIAGLADGSCYITGYIKTIATFGEGELGETVLTPQGSGIGDIYLARYNPDLTLSWAVIAGGEEGDAGLTVTALHDDSAVIAGYYRTDATFDGGGPNETVLDGTAQQKSIFLARYAPNGELTWAVRAYGSDTQSAAEVRGIATLPDGSLVVTGWFQENVTFGPGEPNQATIYAAGGPGNINGFIARYGADGALAWVRRFGSDGSAAGNGVTAGDSSEIYATGYFGDMVTFGSGGSDSIELTAQDAWDVFVVRYSPSGSPQWATAGRSYYSAVGRGVSALSGGGVFTTGYYRNQVTFGQGGPSETTLSGLGMRDIFAATFDGTGQPTWAAGAGGAAADSESDVGRACAALDDGGGLVTGWFSGLATFGAEHEPAETTLESGGTKDAFIARYGADGWLQWARQIGGPGEDRGYGLA